MLTNDPPYLSQSDGSLLRTLIHKWKTVGHQDGNFKIIFEKCDHYLTPQ